MPRNSGTSGAVEAREGTIGGWEIGMLYLSMVYLWYIYGISVVYLWYIHGRFMVYVWYIFGIICISMVHVWYRLVFDQGNPY